MSGAITRFTPGPKGSIWKREAVLAEYRSVLIVEDDHGVAELVQHVLAGEGMPVVLVANAQAMRNALASRQYDAVVLDVRLTGPENGPEAGRSGYSRGMRRHLDDRRSSPRKCFTQVAIATYSSHFASRTCGTR